MTEGFGTDWTCEAHGGACANAGLDWDCSNSVQCRLRAQQVESEEQ
jgi:hypothetical protein